MSLYNQISHKAIFKLYSKDIYRYAYSILKDHEDSQDIVQDVFVKFMETSDSYRGDCSLKTWLIVIARNQCYNLIKSRKVRQGFEKELDTVDFSNTIEDKITVEYALKQLNVEENELIFLREYLGLSYKDIAQLLNITIDNVKVRLFRIKQKLRKVLSDE